MSGDTYRVEMLERVSLTETRWVFARAGLPLIDAKDLAAFLRATGRTSDSRIIPESAERGDR